MVTIDEHHDYCDRKDDQHYQLADELGDLDAMTLLKIQLPEVAVYQCDDERGSQQKHGRTHFPAERDIVIPGCDDEFFPEYLG